MRLAFHYHTPLAIIDGGMWMPGYLGLFVDALAAEVEELYLVLHEASGEQMKEMDYRLQAQNVVWVNLGRKTPAWHRSMSHRTILRRYVSSASNVDVFLLRGPSPLAPFFSRLPQLSGRIAYMVVSDYGKGADFLPNWGIRNLLVKQYSRWVDRSFKNSLASQLVIANSREIYDSLRPLTKHIHEVKTTTLSSSDFYRRCDTCIGETVRLLYSGRIVMDKGLGEIVQAVQKLLAAGFSIEAHFAGWEDKDHNPVTAELLQLGRSLGVQDRLYFHGRKTVGPELNKIYRMADIYVIPSYYEGFPRTIWEAMANSLPVVAASVGSIPKFLKNREEALLVEPRSVSSLVAGIQTIISDSGVRQKLIRSGFLLANQNTLEIQTKRLVGILEDHFKIVLGK
jgi:glycosyltransferase involved in cell wall biosynthesis